MICIRDNPCEGNLNNDNFSNLGDVGILKAAFGTTGCNDPGNNCPEDLNGDGFVNLGDVGILKVPIPPALLLFGSGIIRMLGLSAQIEKI